MNPTLVRRSLLSVKKDLRDPLLSMSKRKKAGRLLAALLSKMREIERPAL